MRRTVLKTIMALAQSAGLLNGQPDEMAEQFSSLLWGDLMIRLLLRIHERPSTRDIGRRAREATAAFLNLYSVGPSARLK
jgi:hypothetical protein